MCGTNCKCDVAKCLAYTICLLLRAAVRAPTFCCCAPVEHGGVTGKVQLVGPGTCLGFTRPGEGGAWDMVYRVSLFMIFAGGVVCVLPLSMVDRTAIIDGSFGGVKHHI
jgi:hypothetical protein